MEGVLNGYVTNPNPTPTLTPNPNHNPNSNPNQINEKIQKETTLEIDQITKCQFGRWKLVKTVASGIWLWGGRVNSKIWVPFLSEAPLKRIFLESKNISGNMSQKFFQTLVSDNEG
jgi:hypothetical protein